MKYIVFGAGNEVRQDYSDEFLSHISYFVDSDETKTGRLFRGSGQEIRSPKTLLDEKLEDIFVIVSCIYDFPEIKKFLENLSGGGVDRRSEFYLGT